MADGTDAGVINGTVVSVRDECAASVSCDVFVGVLSEHPSIPSHPPHTTLDVGGIFATLLTHRQPLKQQTKYMIKEFEVRPSSPSYLRVCPSDI